MITFYKYHGTANDFIMIEDADRQIEKQLNSALIKSWCKRRFGVGADGLILLQRNKDFDFYMKYYNADGNESSMCGNGGRCTCQFAIDRGWVTDGEMTFLAADGGHHAKAVDGKIDLGMKDVSDITRDEEAYVLDTGSPHYVRFDTLKSTDIELEGKRIRYSDRYIKEGINVNIAQITNQKVHMCTYERGVEGETYSCGTGTVAVAIASLLDTGQTDGNYEVDIQTKGGHLAVRCHKESNRFTQIRLIGPTAMVFEGKLSL